MNIFSVVLCQRCREIWREILVKFSVLRFPGFGCATENFTKISRQKRCEKRKNSRKFHSARAQRRPFARPFFQPFRAFPEKWPPAISPAIFRPFPISGSFPTCSWPMGSQFCNMLQISAVSCSFLGNSVTVLPRRGGNQQ